MGTADIMLKRFICDSCRALVELPKPLTDIMHCHACGKDCEMGGFVKMVEIATKGNIDSGISFTASPALLHSNIVNILSKSPDMPLDIFEKAEIVREEHYCVPAYYFQCIGTEPFTYDVSSVRQHKTAIDLGDRTRIEREAYDEWDNGRNSSVNVREAFIVSGNKEFVEIISNVYKYFNAKQIVGIDELEITSDVVTYPQDLSYIVAFNEYVVPNIEKKLKEKARASIASHFTRNLHMGGSNIQKDETVRVFCSIYRVVISYGEIEYSVWFNGNGSQWYTPDDLPMDLSIVDIVYEEQKNVVETKDLDKLNEQLEQIDLLESQEMETLDRSIGCVSIVTASLGLTSIILGFAIHPIFFLGIVFFLPVILPILKARKQSEVNTSYLKLSDDDFLTPTRYVKITVKEQHDKIVKDFKAQKQALRGIYEHVSGDTNAFK